MSVNAPGLKSAPPWLKVRAPSRESYDGVTALAEEERVHTICKDACCPNIAECWEGGTATFVVLDDLRTRVDRSSLVGSVGGLRLDLDEPSRIARAVRRMGLRHVAVACANRTELPDGGAFLLARTIALVRRASPSTTIEASVPDFGGSHNALEIVLSAEPEVLHHEIGTVPRLFPRHRPEASYARSLELLQRVKQLDSEILVKTGLMLGLGETRSEIVAVMKELAEKTMADVLTLGQHLRLTETGALSTPEERFYHPSEFQALASLGRQMGFRHVEAGPLVRGSYRSAEHILKIHRTKGSASIISSSQHHEALEEEK